MSFWKKLANVATGGTLGMLQGIKNRDFKAIASGGFLNSKKRPAGMSPIQASPEAQAFFNSQSAEDQENIRNSFGQPQGGIGNMLNQWYSNAKAAGSVPANFGQPAAQPGAVQPGAMPAPQAGAAFQPPQGVQNFTQAAPGIAGMLTNTFAPQGAPPAQQPQQPLMSYEDWKAAGRPNVPHEG